MCFLAPTKVGPVSLRPGAVDAPHTICRGNEALNGMHPHADAGDVDHAGLQEDGGGARSMPHILSSSSTMLGVCMTVLSLSRLDEGHQLHWLIDKMVALAALMFLASSISSFLSLRGHRGGRLAALRLERRAEMIFMSGLSLLGLGAVLLAFIVR